MAMGAVHHSHHTTPTYIHIQHHLHIHNYCSIKLLICHHSLSLSPLSIPISTCVSVFSVSLQSYRTLIFCNTVASCRAVEYALVGDQGKSSLDKGGSDNKSSKGAINSKGSSSSSGGGGSVGNVDGSYDVLSYHGDLNSKERESNLQSFKDGHVQYLVSRYQLTSLTTASDTFAPPPFTLALLSQSLSPAPPFFLLNFLLLSGLYPSCWSMWQSRKERARDIHRRQKRQGSLILRPCSLCKKVCCPLYSTPHALLFHGWALFLLHYYSVNNINVVVVVVVVAVLVALILRYYRMRYRGP